MTPFDIDLVYLWADGNDEAWMTKKNIFLGKDATSNTESTSKARTANHDELLYSLRSIEKNANWIRKIFIVTDEQTPQWLNRNNEKIQIVDIREIIPAEALPCYNSVIIEHFLYKIPGLSEHFLYSNDDMFILKPVEPSFFFNQDGLPIVRLQKSHSNKLSQKIKALLNIDNNIYRRTIRNAANLIHKKWGIYFTAMPHHNMDAYLKSAHRDVVEREFPTEINGTIQNHIRSEKDIQRIIYLYYLLATKQGILRYVNRYESMRLRVHKGNFEKKLSHYSPSFFCINDSHRSTDDDRKQIKPFLENVFPEPSSFEV